MKYTTLYFSIELYVLCSYKVLISMILRHKFMIYYIKMFLLYFFDIFYLLDIYIFSL